MADAECLALPGLSHIINVSNTCNITHFLVVHPVSRIFSFEYILEKSLHAKKTNLKDDYWRNAIIIDKLSSCDKEKYKVNIQVKIHPRPFNYRLTALSILKHVSTT